MFSIYRWPQSSLACWLEAIYTFPFILSTNFFLYIFHVNSYMLNITLTSFSYFRFSTVIMILKFSTISHTRILLNNDYVAHALTPNTKQSKFAQVPLPLGLNIHFCHLKNGSSKIFCINNHWNQA